MKIDDLTPLIRYQSRRVEYYRSTRAVGLAYEQDILDVLKDYKKVLKEVEDNKKSPPPKIPFDKFWFAYAKKVGRADCRIFWEKRMTDQQREAAILHIPKYKKAQPDIKYRLDPIRYLKRKRYMDEIEDENCKEEKTEKAWLTGAE
jgi:hypothetical protein